MKGRNASKSKASTKRPRLAVVVEYLIGMGGIQREITVLNRYFDIDLHIGHFYKLDELKRQFPDYNTIRIHQYLKRDWPTWFTYLYMRWKSGRLNLRGHDAVLNLGGGTVHVLRNNHPNVWYVNSPQRWMYDMYQMELSRRGPLRRLFFSNFVKLMRIIDRKAVRHADTIISNSHNIGGRVFRAYGIDVDDVAYPSIDLRKYRFKKQGDFYLSTARITEQARVEMMIEAFKKMPDQKLVIASGGPWLEKIKALAAGSPNITVLGFVTEEKLHDLYNTCRCLLYMVHKPDFTLTTGEAMAAGKPSIVCYEEGAKETITHSKTGYFLKDGATAQNLIKAVRYMTAKRCLSMRAACQQRVKMFSDDEFARVIGRGIERVQKRMNDGALARERPAARAARAGTLLH